MKVEEAQELAPTDKKMKFSDTVKFEIAYPKDYGKMPDGKFKKKHFKDGDVIELHSLQAEDWASRGLGKIVK